MEASAGPGGLRAVEDPGLRPPVDKEPGAKAQVRRLFQEAEDPEMRRYLALVLGGTGDREALPLLTAALDEEDDRTRIYALWALGILGDARAH